MITECGVSLIRRVQSNSAFSTGLPRRLSSSQVPLDSPPSPFRLADYGEESLYTLVLLRHERGEQEARTAGRLLLENDIEIDQAFTSVLKRASFSCNMALKTARSHWVPVTKTWRLNERHYGALQGFNKDTAWKELGLDQELVMQMRRAYDVRPPRMDNDHKYRVLTSDQMEKSRAESLKDAAERVVPFFESVIVPSMQAGNKCLIVSHANTIRTLVKHVDQICDENIKGMSIPTGIPLLYRLDKDMKPVDPHIELEFRYLVEPRGYTWGTSRQHGFHGVYLGDLERLQDIQQRRDTTNRDWQRIILRNIGKSLGWRLDEPETDSKVVATRQLWFQVHSKMQKAEYQNMLLLAKMEDALEHLMYVRNQRFITQAKYEELVNQLHLDAKGTVVEPFVAVADQTDRAEREKAWYENLSIEMEEECSVR